MFHLIYERFYRNHIDKKDWNDTFLAVSLKVIKFLILTKLKLESLHVQL